MAAKPKTEDTQMKTAAGGKKSITPRRTLFSLLSGGLIDAGFFRKHKLQIFALVVLIMWYIATKYECMTGMENIQKLEKELDVVKTERIRQSSRYMSRIRESSMAGIADSIRPGLRVQQQPPYVIGED